ncbi:MAG TPA: prephenate dehydratase [Terriglobia bacterium]|nr:prephenate dehydratase [Terriglobia bacterium]
MPERTPPRVAFQGERGAYSEIAARRFFGEAVDLLPCESFDLVFKRVESNKAEAGIVPIENSQAGCIHQNYDLLLKHRLRIVGELNLRVEHNLIGHPGAALKSIRTVFSHPQALMQCQGNTAKLRGVKIVAAYDTAGSVKKIKDEKLLNAAAIASELAARTYGMKILKKGIQDNPENFTRFLVLRKTKATATNANKTSLVFSLRNVPGALFRSLSAFALRDIDLYKIESRPLHGKPWEYFFYIDFAGSPRQPECRNALANLAEIATFMKVLGSYPRDSRKL